MNRGFKFLIVMIAAGFLFSAGCGKKAPPVAPDAKLSGTISDLREARTVDAVNSDIASNATYENR